MAKKYKTKLKGGMTRTWISDIRKHPRTTQAVSDTVSKAINSANAAIKVRYPKMDFFSWFYKDVKLKGKWGTTHIINPTTPMSRKRREVLETALKKNGLMRK